MSENVTALIDLIAQGKNAEASEFLNRELLTRSYQEIQDITPDIAQSYFAPVVGEPEYEEETEEETEEEYDEEELLDPEED